MTIALILIDGIRGLEKGVESSFQVRKTFSIKQKLNQNALSCRIHNRLYPFESFGLYLFFLSFSTF